MPCTNVGGGLWILVELVFPSMESSFVSFVNKPCRLCVSIFVSGVWCCVVLCSMYFLPFSVSYHFPFIFAVILCFFFLVRMSFFASVIVTWIVMYWWYHVVLHWCNGIVCRHLLA